MATNSNQDLYLKRGEVGVGGGVAATNALAVANLASGGSVGTAATTVDLYGVIMINQTTASQTITLPDPTDTTAGKVLFVLNVGSQTFTMLGLSVTADHGIIVVWDGDEWNCVAKGF